MTTDFDLTGALPGRGVTVLEASAGTGKTYTVSALATRYIAENVTTLDRLLVITFSRAATQELRDRVRAAFVDAAKALAEPDVRTRDDEIGALTRGADGAPLSDDEIAERRQRLLDAIAGYDAATIATTHEFCNAVLRSLGVAGDSDSHARLHEDINELRDEVVEDHWVARYSASDTDPPISFYDASKAARAAIENRHAELRPRDPEDPAAAELVGFSAAVREELELRKRRAAVFTYDDMLSRLADAVRPQGDAPARAAALRMRARWEVVLVDEFQDTDPVQWDVLRDAFATDCRLVLIGDPKQAIYAFRGGDTPTYLAAVEGATTYSLGTNFRSDGPVVAAVQALTRGAALGDDRIVVHEVAADRDESSLSSAGGFRLRQVRREGFRINKSGTIPIGVVREHIAEDLAADIARQLNAGILLDGRPLGPGDIAVLLRSASVDGPRIQAALARRGVPSVINAAESVMLGPAADHWLRLLEAMEKPQLSGRIRAAALTPFFVITPTDLLQGGEDLTDQVAECVRRWLDLFRSRGIAAVLGAAQAGEPQLGPGGLAQRALSDQGGERLLTDLVHIGQLLHQAAVEQRLGITGLLGWMREAVAEGNRNDSRRRRLDVDAEAVQLVTIHGSKGLEYPVVYAPDLFDSRTHDYATVHAYHEGAVRCLDVADTPAAKKAAQKEDAQEELRLAYVALTRARAQVTVWWAPTWDGPNGALTRLIFGRQPGAAQVPDRGEFGKTDDEVDAELARWAAAGAFRIEPSTIAPDEVSTAPSGENPQARTFDRDLDTEWRRTSYSGLIRADEGTASLADSEVENPGTEDEIEPAEVDAASELTPDAEVRAEFLSPMNGLPAGATFGSLVHAVLEHADPAAPDLRAELLGHVEDQRRWWDVPSSSDELVEALIPMQYTPLGPLADGLTLAQIGLRDRLRELDFEIPMAGGDVEDADGLRTSHQLAAFADAIERHLAPLGAGPTSIEAKLIEYAAKLRGPGLGNQVLRGYLSGSIDVVLRIHGGDGPRFVVVDYKTNTLGEPGRDLTAWDYTPEKVADAMVHSHYPLQALLYSVVLHRYLRWRLPDYDPARHLGGTLYLYLRGMVGEQTPVVDGVPCGVFSWLPPVPLILELSAILDGEARS